MQESTKFILTFAYTDEGFCRVMYKDVKKRLFCLQDEGNCNFIFYYCTNDEEPVSAIDKTKFSFQLTNHESGIGKDADDFLKVQGIETYV